MRLDFSWAVKVFVRALPRKKSTMGGTESILGARLKYFLMARVESSHLAFLATRNVQGITILSVGLPKLYQKWRDGQAFKASIPTNVPCARKSSMAPPPVETNVKESSNDSPLVCFSSAIAASVSPPPTTDFAPRLVA